MRQAQVTRNTLETQISVKLDLDGTGKSTLATGIGFFDHMLDQVARHGMLDLEIAAKAICTSMRTTRSKMSASRWGRRSRRRSATRRASAATDTPMCRSTRRCRAW